MGKCGAAAPGCHSAASAPHSPSATICVTHLVPAKASFCLLLRRRAPTMVRLSTIGAGNMLNRLFCLAVVGFAVMGAANAAIRDTTADAVLGQPDFAQNGANQPAGTPTASNLALSNAAHLAVAPTGRLYVS